MWFVIFMFSFMITSLDRTYSWIHSVNSYWVLTSARHCVWKEEGCWFVRELGSSQKTWGPDSCCLSGWGDVLGFTSAGFLASMAPLNSTYFSQTSSAVQVRSSLGKPRWERVRLTITERQQHDYVLGQENLESWITVQRSIHNYDLQKSSIKKRVTE